jgi:hypothetical protein
MPCWPAWKTGKNAGKQGKMQPRLYLNNMAQSRLMEALLEAQDSGCASGKWHNHFPVIVRNRASNAG